MWTRKAILAAGGAALVAGCGGEDEERRERRARVAADLEIVRFLLDVEHVAASFWAEVVSRGALRAVGAADLAQEVSRNEATHVEALERYERRLGGRIRDRAPLTFASVFAAGPREVLRSGATLGNVAAAAYVGQLNRLQDRNLLASVLAIHSVEGRQAAALHLEAADVDGAFPSGAFAEPMNMDAVRSRLRRFTAA